MYQNIYDWLLNYEPLNNWLYFNVTNYELGTTSLNSVATSRELKKDILGKATVEIVASIDMIKQYDTELNDNNMTALNEVNSFADWVEDNKSLLSIDDVDIEKIEVMQRVPILSVDNDNNLAKYQFQIKITYKER